MPVDGCTSLKKREKGRCSYGVLEEHTVDAHEKPGLLGRLAWYRRSLEASENQSAVDDLTGLRSQRVLWGELDRRVSLCSPAHPLSIVMIDFDRLSDVNEGYGREVGDALLRRGASVVRSAAESPRLAFRFGGEEFVVLVEGDEDEARERAERIRLALAAQNGALPAITVSCGVAELDTPVEPWVALDRADAALRDAKRSGRDRVSVAGRISPGERMLMVEELEHETARRAAMALAVATLQVRDRDTADHSEDVVTLCEAVGRRLGFADHALQQLRSGATLHDVGKVAMPTSILNKPGALNQAEWAVIREHTLIGERILRSVPEMAEVATIVRHSHERWDGQGYPDGLAGDQIPPASRVILCADAFHAMRCDRPYRRGRPAREAIAELEACSGTQFDPSVVNAFIEVATDARNGRAATASSRPNKRLIVLLTTLIIGGGSAVAGVPEVRDALKSVFGASTAPSHASPEVTDGDFGFGPLGDLLSLERAGDHKRSGHAKGARDGNAARSDHGRANRTGAHHNGATFSVPESRGGSGGPGTVRGTSGPGDTTPESEPSPQTDGGVPGGSPTDVPGRGLGQDVAVPRRPAQSPSQHPGGRTDPPALGLHAGPAPHANGKANGH